MKSKEQLQNFILSIRDELEEFVTLTKLNPDSKIIQLFNQMYQKYLHLNIHLGHYISF
mgnify:CR=1 FL=1